MGREPSVPTCAFGRVVHEMLAARAMSRIDLARRIGISEVYLYKLIGGKKAVSAERAESIAVAIGATPAGRIRLHRAAATDAGYVLDLTSETPTPPPE